MTSFQADQPSQLLLEVEKLRSQLNTASMGPALTINANELTVGDQVGSGGFSVVYRGTWLGTPVAVKKWFDSNATQEQRTQIRQEIMTLADLRHPNIVQFCGSCSDGNTLMVTEFLPFNLADVLYSMTNVELKGGKLIGIALDIARAFTYLHSRKPKVIHRDIKPQNFLLDRAWKVKVCDFGLAASPKTGAGTPAYMAPELFQNSTYTEKVDVYAVGVLLNEMYIRRQPFHGKDAMQIQSEVLAGKRPEMSLTTPSNLKECIEACWHQDANQRPTFESLCAQLAEMK